MVTGIRNYLNQRTGNLIDWNRPGSLLFGNHHYTTQELAERGFVIASTAIMGYLSWNLTASPGCAALGAAIGFLTSHAITMYPLIKKRREAKSACEHMKKELENLFSDETNTDEEAQLSQLIPQVIEEVMNYADSKSPSLIWGKRARLMSTLVEWTKDRDNLEQLLSSPAIIDLLDKNNRDLSVVALSPTY